MSRDFGLKNGQHSNASEVQDFQVKRNQQTKKMRNYTFYKMAISNFRFFLFLTQKNQNFDFSKNAQKTIFIDIQKTEIHIIELCATSM